MTNKKLEDYLNRVHKDNFGWRRIKTNNDGVIALLYSHFGFSIVPDNTYVIRKEALDLLDELKIEYEIVDFRTGKGDEK